MSIPPVSAIADVLALAGLDGWLTPPLLPVVASPQPVMGRALTIELRAESPGNGLSPLHQLVSRDLRDRVIVIAGGIAIGGAVWGEIMSRAARRQGATALLLDGVARDVAAMAGEGLPVYAAQLAVVGPAGRASIVGIGTAVDVGGVCVAPDDAVIVDSSGAVRVSAAICDGVLDAARTYAAAEAQVLDALAAGEPLVEAYRFKKLVVEQLTATVDEWARGHCRHPSRLSGYTYTPAIGGESRQEQAAGVACEAGGIMPGSANSYVSGAAGAPLLGDTVGAALARTVDRVPHREALVSIHQGVRWSYRELADEVERVALGLLALGIEKGDRVGIWAPNCAEWTVLQFATSRVGAILVNINPAYRPGEFEFAMAHSGVRMLVTAAQYKSSDYLEMLASVRAALPALDRVVTIDGDRATATDLVWSELVAASAGATPQQLAARERALDADDPINIQYTSGTTGRPKGATLTHHNIVNNAYAMAEILGYTDADRVCIPLPLYHCFGMGVGNLGCITTGATMVYPAATFDPVSTMQAVQDERCTSLYGVPTMWIAQLEHPRFAEFDLTSLRTGLMGGSPCPIEVMKRAVSDMHASEVCIVYGMTETAPISFITRPDDDLERRVSTVGRAMPNVEAKIVDPVTGYALPRGVAGEVCTRGYAVMRGYWNDATATADAVDAGGWMHTGDLGVIDDEGYLNIVGRMRDMVIRGGENIYPREIEEVLFQHPAIGSAQVIGVPDALTGEELMAWVVVRDGITVDEDELRAFCKARLAHFKVPRYWQFVDEFPMTVTGKIQKFKMREIAIESLGLQEAAAIKTA